MCSYLRKNIDLTLAILFALISTVIVMPAADKVLASINFSLLALLFSLMGIVAGLRQSGLLASLYSRLFKGEVQSLSIARFFIFSCFFSSMLITNDVALIIFVPLSIMVLTEIRMFRLFIPTITLETVAANMGSMLTPIGNPQNLFIYAFYQLPLKEFFQITAPVTLLSALLLWLISGRLSNKTIVIPDKKTQFTANGKLYYLGFLFILCLLNVLRLMPIEILFPLVLDNM